MIGSLEVEVLYPVSRRISAFLGDRKRAPEPLRDRAEGIKQDNEKVLLVSNIKVDGKPIGAFGEGELWSGAACGFRIPFVDIKCVAPFR